MMQVFKMEHLRDSIDGFVLFSSHVPVLNLVIAYGIYKAERAYFDELDKRNML